MKNICFRIFLKKNYLYILAILICNSVIIEAATLLDKTKVEFNLDLLFWYEGNMFKYGIIILEYLYFIVKYLEYYRGNIILRQNSQLQAKYQMSSGIFIISCIFCFVHLLSNSFLLFVNQAISKEWLMVVLKVFILQFASLSLLGQWIHLLYSRGIKLVVALITTIIMLFIGMAKNPNLITYFITVGGEIRVGCIERLIFLHLMVILCLTLSKGREYLDEI